MEMCQAMLINYIKLFTAINSFINFLIIHLFILESHC